MNAPASHPDLKSLLREVRACRLCESSLPHEPRPVLQVDPRARVLIAGQAPGRLVHEGGVPFDDASGDRLRDWLGVNAEEFYDPTRIAILPMGFCYPGRGRSGDLAPRSECAPAWRKRLLANLGEVRLTVVIGRYAIDYHLPDPGRNLTETVRAWRRFAPTHIPLPHPSPRNNIWLKKNPWFAAELLPQLKLAVAQALRTR